MKIMVQRCKFLFLSAGVLVLVGCGANKRQDAELSAMKAEIATLNKQTIQQRKQIDDLNNKLFILHDRMETVRTQMARTPAKPVPQPPSATARPLKVVKLAPAPDTRRPRKAPRKVVPKLIENYNPDEEEAAFVPVEAITSSKPTPATAEARSSDPNVMYQRAFEILKTKAYGDAILAFDQFVKSFPNHDLADNALYWLGECYYDQGEHMLAIQEFRRVPELYPTGNKVPDALLKIGFAYAALGDKQAARRTLRQLVEAYPQSEATRLAQLRLAELKGGSKTR